MPRLFLSCVRGEVVKRCRERDCSTLLSSFNQGDRCFLHSDPAWPDHEPVFQRIYLKQLQGVYPEHGLTESEQRHEAIRERYRSGEWLT